ncbi:MAG: hypothetical protein CL609_17090 [Anaerolineaceae bacterium]|nr:hypothetical protein [Anaerolineaceae bacterium]
MVSWQQVGLGLLFAIGISGLSYRVGVLNRSGALAASVLGLVVFGFGGWSWAVVLLGFFITSSGLSKLLKKRKQDLSEKFSKGSNRDAGQVFANGGVAGFFVLFHIIFPQATWPWLAFAGAFAAVNADTWGTELGVLSRQIPRSILSGKPVERGTSGGITLWGTLAGAIGAFLIALLAVLTWPKEIPNPMQALPWLPLVAITLAGVFGSLVDSLIGATIQSMYYCPKCKKETERSPLHSCGTKTKKIRGWIWMDNDWVNILCAVTGALVMVISVLI